MVELRQMKRVLAIMSICACLCGCAALADVQRSNRLVVDVYDVDSDKEWEAASDVALVADVEGVYFDSTENVEWSVNSRDMTLPEAVYRIEHEQLKAQIDAFFDYLAKRGKRMK